MCPRMVQYNLENEGETPKSLIVIVSAPDFHRTASVLQKLWTVDTTTAGKLCLSS